MPPYTEFLSVAKEAARQAGHIIMGSLGNLGSGDIDLKQASDFVTRIDRESEQAIIETIKDRFSDHAFMAEESGTESGTVQSDYLWVIDPLDGTTNYIHSYPMFAVSIALCHKDEVIAGVVLDPLRNELFTATKGGGAFLNGRPITVSTCTDLGRCLIATGFPFRQKNVIDEYLKAFKAIFLQVSGIRRAGAAALDFAHLACGRSDGFFEFGLSAWDVAAGSLLITEAGGKITDFSGGRDYLRTGNVVAGNTTAVHDMLLQSIQGVFRGIIDQ